MGSYRGHCWSRRTCSIHFTLLMVLVLLAGVLVAGSRVRSKKHKTSRGTSAVMRWQSRASTEGTPNAIHEFAVKPAPFSKPAHTSGAPGSGGGPMKRAYYVPTVTNLENKLHHFINNLKTGIGASKLAHAVNGVTGAFQQQLPMASHAAVNLLGSPYRSSGVHGAAGYFGTANELRYGQPFVAKQAAGHLKSVPVSYGKKGAGNGKGGKRGRSTAAPPAKYDSLMSDLGISGYKHFENAVIRDLERREELKVEATIHTLFPEAGDDDWHPITVPKKPSVTLKQAGNSAGTRPTGPVLSESKLVPAMAAPAVKRPHETGARQSKPKQANSVVHSEGGRYGSSSTSTTSPKSTAAPFASGHKHRSKGVSPAKEKRTKERTKCWNCVNSTTTSITTRQPLTVSDYPFTKAPTVSAQPPRFGPTYGAAMFYGSDGKSPAAIGAVAHSYSNVEMHYNRTVSPPLAVGPWTHVTAVVDEVSTQSAPPVTTFSGVSDAAGLYAAAIVKKSFSKPAKPYSAPQTTAFVGLGSDAAVTSSTTTHKPTGGSQGTKGTTKKRTTHKSNGHSVGGHPRWPQGMLGDSVGAGSSKTDLRVRKKFDPKYIRNRGSIKFKDALQENPDQIYR